MWSLTTRFAVLLVASVTGVIVLAALITATLVQRPSEDQFGLVIAEKAQLALELFRGDPAAARRAGVETGGPPPEDRINHHMTERINAVLDQLRPESEAVVFRDGPDDKTKLAVRINDDTFAYLAFPNRPRPPWGPLTLYLTIVAVGIAGIAIYLANRMMQPFRMLESTIGAISADGTIPTIPEKGPPEVRVTAGAINRLSGRLNAAVESRMRLVAAAGHDLRTPMTRMRLRAEFFDEEERTAWLKDIDELDRIADSAIRLVREEVSEDSRQAIRLDGMLEEIGRELGDLGHPVSIEPLAPTTIQATPLAVKRALRNLLVNAATHGGGASVSMTLDAKEVAVVIEDDGPGIPEDMMHRVFEPFFRVDEARRKFYPGAGLGLAIAREILGNNGGTLALANRPAGGLRQVVTFPRAPQA